MVKVPPASSLPLICNPISRTQFSGVLLETSHLPGWVLHAEGDGIAAAGPYFHLVINRKPTLFWKNPIGPQARFAPPY